MIRYSIIVPIHNSSSGLALLLETVPRRLDVEVVVIDDHSSQDEKIKAQSIIGASVLPHIRFFSNEGRNNAGTARNLGVSKARGSWLIFCDSDDVLDAKALNHAMDEYADADWEIVYFPPLPTKRTAYMLTQFHKFLRGKIDEEMYGYNNVVPWSKFVKRTLVDRHQIRFDEVRHSNDMTFSTLACFHAKKRRVEQGFAYYNANINDKSLTRSKHSLDDLELRISVMIKNRDFLMKHKGERYVYRGEYKNRGRLMTYATFFRQMSPKYILALRCLLRKNGVSLLTRSDFSIIYDMVVRVKA